MFVGGVCVCLCGVCVCVGLCVCVCVFVQSHTHTHTHTHTHSHLHAFRCLLRFVVFFQPILKPHGFSPHIAVRCVFFLSSDNKRVSRYLFFFFQSACTSAII